MSIPRAALLVAVPAALLLGCPKGNESGAGPAPAPAPDAPAKALSLDGPECTALRARVAALATAARKCTPASAAACQRCVVGHLFQCGFFVGDEGSAATKDYLAARAELVEKSCMQPWTVSPPCAPDPAGKCGADGSCTPAWCNVPPTKPPG